MAKKKSVSGGGEWLSNEQLRKITEAASVVAIEQYHKEHDRVRKENRSKKLHNTRLLMENYRAFVVHCKLSIDDALQVEDDYDLQTLIDMMTEGNDSHALSVQSIRESAARTRTILHHVDKMLAYYRFRCESSGKAEIMRRYDTINGLYIDEYGKSPQELADEFFVDLSTVYRYNRAALQDLSALMFGCVD